MWWLLLPGILIAVFIFLLFTPLRFDVNSDLGWIGIRYGRLAEASLLFNEVLQVVRVRMGWWKKEYTLEEMLRRRKPPAAVKPERVQRRPGKKPDVGRMLRKIRSVLGSFRLTKCDIAIDTGDVQTNAILYPFFYLLKWKTGKNISISFTGETVLVLQAENTLARMLWAYIKS